MQNRNHYKTIVLSDVHMGSHNSNTRELIEFLRANTADMLILNGDIIDGWKIRNGEKWKKKYTRFFRVVLKMMEKYNTEVVYIRGNHDDFLDAIIPFVYGDLWIVKEHIHYSKGKKYLVVHGDSFDPVANKFRWLLKLGLAGFPLTIWIYKAYNRLQERKNRPRFTLSQVKTQIPDKTETYISGFENNLVKLARKKECHGVICGHVHQPSIKQHGDIVYMNSGDWVGSMSALVEDYNGKWSIAYYNAESQF